MTVLELHTAVADEEQVAPQMGALITATLIGIVDEGLTALVLHAKHRGSAALRARTIVDLHGAHIGREVLLAFEGGDPSRPIVVGCLRQGHATPPADAPGHVEVLADGERVVVSAKEQLVLQCGKARITLTRAGKVIIEGAYVSSRSSGAIRLMGASVQLN